MPKQAEDDPPAAELIQGEPVEIAGKVIQPVARIQSWQLPGKAGGAGFARLSPHAVQVRQGEQTFTVPIVEPDQVILRQIKNWGAIISGLCLLIMMVSRLGTMTQPKHRN